MLPKAPKPLNLKQRLAALTQAPSSPSSYVEPISHMSPVAKRRFNAPWSRRQDTVAGFTGESEERLQDVMSKMIYQAGVDYEVIINASAMPDAHDVNYDILLTCETPLILPTVESDYTVVFFAAGNKHSPGWNWVWKAYRSLSRKYRKNLKRLFIVHSNFFSKMLFSLAGAFISPKFFRKITYVDTLSELAYHVPLTQIDIPPAVYQENLKHEREITLLMPTQSNLFGVPLGELMGYDGEKGGIPRVVKDAIQYLRETGLQDEGLFRRSPNSALLRQVKEAYDRGNVVTLENFNDPHLAAVLLKKYIRDLPEALFPEEVYPIILSCPAPTYEPDDWSSVLYIREHLFPLLPRCNYILLSHTLHLLHEVSNRSNVNLMDAHNLAIVVCPNLVSGSSPARDIAMCTIPNGPTMHSSIPTTAAPVEGRTTLGQIIKLCIQRYYEVFDEVEDRSEALLPRKEEPGTPSSTSSPRLAQFRRQSVLSKSSSNRDSRIDDDESIDDEMLVMPIGPGGGAPPSSWAGGPHTIGASTFRPRHRSGLSGGGSRSLHTGAGGAGGTARARSVISVEPAVSGTMRRSSITIGRGTSRKAPGAGVQAIGVTASGFFSPPNAEGDAPLPAPALPTDTAISEVGDNM
ncbi:hypothetical protein K488DRAFT_78077 [Vararia minispora EC-137]|uniref:Uncharacterized protein n=1 Tax=Vararia minispora EC-137 TaxID=1314806 RepID=A0ACB8QMZ2_9AGAM|nr:hypothetical protein K488DRAFT_78077 [Vararia minispora EC-137]